MFFYRSDLCLDRTNMHGMVLKVGIAPCLRQFLMGWNLFPVPPFYHLNWSYPSLRKQNPQSYCLHKLNAAYSIKRLTNPYLSTIYDFRFQVKFWSASLPALWAVRNYPLT